MSASAVFSVIEILQQILCELPPLDIIRCQRMNSIWKQLIADSPLLQYQAWLRDDVSDPAYRVRYISTISTHLHPIVVANIMKHLPKDPRFSFDPLNNMDLDGFGGYFNMSPVHLRDLMQWYERNKATEHIWGDMSLYRPEACRVCWEMPDSEGAGIPVRLEAVPTKVTDPNSDYTGWGFEVNKKPAQSLVLTVGDLMRKMDYA
ncbi:hypothetical protein DE146DRAFT_759405 [Phaeosphaeria sp. MPI-PUGE-AT-0046c]|nr:hypothetical protein DE146DRAFT_759405 [Phaeosphaeria sp. MPI-PUGE-AT-0046c]